MMRLFVLLTLVTIPAFAETGSECFDSNECDVGECCVLSPQAYSRPGCQTLRHLQDTCRPNNTAFDGQVTFPNGDTIYFTNVYSAVCPCDVGLTCVNDGRCVIESS